jgi:adenylate kinase
MSYKVIYLTGAPCAGKTSLANGLAKRLTEIDVFNYGKAMVRRLQSRKGSSTEVDLQHLRKDTYALVTADDVRAVDDELVTWISQYRRRKHLIIDTHQVALGSDGLCSLSFSRDRLAQMSFNEVWVLAAPSETIRSRILSDPQGRIVPNAFMAEWHATLQAGLAMSYAGELGCYLRLFDSSQPLEEVISSALHVLNA